MSDPSNGNRQDHSALRMEVAEVRKDLGVHLIEAAVFNSKLKEHLRMQHLSQPDVEVIVGEKMEEAKQAGRSSVSLQRERNQLALARVGIAGTVVSSVLLILKTIGVIP